MPRKKTETNEQANDQNDSFLTDNLDAAISASTNALEQLARLEGIDAADRVWEAYEGSFSARLQQRFKEQIPSFTTTLKNAANRLKERQAKRIAQRENLLKSLRSVKIVDVSVAGLIGTSTWEENNEES